MYSKARRQALATSGGLEIAKSACDPQTVVYNGVFDYNKLQGTYSATDLINRIPRDINHRYITVENPTDKIFACAITTDPNTTPAKPDFLIGYNAVIELGINDSGSSSPQYLWVLNRRGHPMGPPSILEKTANSFVIRDGLNLVYIQRFRNSGYKATS
jgi:hypothetical protein